MRRPGPDPSSGSDRSVSMGCRSEDRQHRSPHQVVGRRRLVPAAQALPWTRDLVRLAAAPVGPGPARSPQHDRRCGVSRAGTMPATPPATRSEHLDAIWEADPIVEIDDEAVLRLSGESPGDPAGRRRHAGTGLAVDADRALPAAGLGPRHRADARRRAQYEVAHISARNCSRSPTNSTSTPS